MKKQEEEEAVQATTGGYFESQTERFAARTDGSFGIGKIEEKYKASKEPCYVNCKSSLLAH